MKSVGAYFLLGFGALLCAPPPSAEAQKRPDRSAGRKAHPSPPKKDRPALRPAGASSSTKNPVTPPAVFAKPAEAPAHPGVDDVRRQFLGYVRDAAGKPAKLWGSEIAPDAAALRGYEYLGKLQFDSKWLHVWMEPAAESAAREGAPPDKASEPLSDEELSVANAVPQAVDGAPEGEEASESATASEKVPSSAAGRGRIVILPPDPPITHNGADPNLTPIAPNPAPKRP
jgi:hypothetical protein